MRCPQCEHDNPPGARFCNACGSGLASACRACGQVNTRGSRFCGACGQALGPPEILAPPPRFDFPGAYTPPHLAQRILAGRTALEGERKRVTVLFADTKGSMELLADRDPEDARRLLDAVLERMMGAVHRFEGTVNQVLGDGIMALFGAPLAHENHAVRACYAALRMQEDVGRYGDEMQRALGVPIQIRVGLNSGEVVVGSIGSDLRMEYSAVGQTTHLAARMEQMAKPASVLLTADTLRLAEGYVQARPLGPVPVRGLTDPVEVFELLSATPVRTRLQVAAARGLTSLVGRQAELGLLRQALDLAQNGRGQVVALVGEAGVGKSRLAWELARSHRTRDWLVLEGSAPSYGKATTWLPVIELLRTYFRIEGGDDPRTVREKLIGRLLALDEALRPTLGAFEALLETPVEEVEWSRLDAATRQRRTVEAVKSLLLRESQVQPLLLVLEDLHWIDGATQALLDGLVESLPAARVLLLVNYRPEYQHGWSGKTYYGQLRLDPLPAETAEGMLDTLMGEDADLAPLKRLLIDRTQGNPFFLEETVRSLVESRALTGAPGDYRLVTALPAIQVPATVQAVLAARIDRLSPEDKRLLQLASVIGKDVPLPLLRAVADVAEQDLESSLARLQTAEFLYETRLFPDPEYAFRHTLTLEVAYGSLLHERRRELHARIVDTLERLYPDRLSEQAARLAHHAFRGEVWAKALGYLERQSQTAASRSSLDAVLGSAESAGALWWSGEHARAIEVGQRDLAISANFRSFGLSVVAMCRLGQSYHALGDYGRGADFFRRTLAALRGDLEREQLGMAGLPSVFARAWLAWCLAELGDFSEGIARAEEGVAIAEAADHVYSRVLAAWGLGTLQVVRGDPERAIPVLERGMVEARMADLPLLFPFVAAPLGAAYALAGRAGDACPLLEQGVGQALPLNLLAHHALRLAWLGEALVLAGLLEQAGDQAAQALALAERLGERGSQAYALRLAGEIATRREPLDAEAAIAAYRGALALATELGMRPLAARCRLDLGAFHQRTGARAEGQAELDAAIEIFRELRMTHWLTLAEALGAAAS